MLLTIIEETLINIITSKIRLCRLLMFYKRGGGGIPESMDTIYSSRHVLSVVNVCRLWVKDLQEMKSMYLSDRHMNNNNYNLPYTIITFYSFVYHNLKQKEA